MQILKEKNAILAQLDDREEELQELLKKYKAQVQQVGSLHPWTWDWRQRRRRLQSSVDHITLNDQVQTIADLEREKEALVEKVCCSYEGGGGGGRRWVRRWWPQVGELETRGQWQSAHTVDKHKLTLAEQKIRELEAKLNLEVALKDRIEASSNKVTIPHHIPISGRPAKSGSGIAVEGDG